MKRLFLRPLLFSLIILVVACGNKEDDGTPANTFPQITINSVSKFEGNTETFFDFSVRLSASSDDVVLEHVLR